MYDFFSYFLSPLIQLYKLIHSFIFSLITFSDISVILLSIASFILLIPLLRRARVSENKFSEKIAKVNYSLESVPTDLKGELRFNRIEQIYRDHSYHPIENIKMGLSFIVILPFFVSAYIFFQQNLDIFQNQGFFFQDLSSPDNLILGFNILPLVIFLINLIDANFKYKQQKSMKSSYLLTSFLICFLIYNMPLCMTLYWATNSILSFSSNFKPLNLLYFK